MGSRPAFLVSLSDPPARVVPMAVLQCSATASSRASQGGRSGFSGPLSDRVGRRELYETYVDAVAMNDAELWASTWVDDCVWHIAGQTTEGKDKTAPCGSSLWTTSRARCSLVLLARSRSTMTPQRGVTTRSRSCGSRQEAFSDCKGRYADEIVRRDGRWLFKNRSYTVVQEVPITVPDHG
jgi:hypothetical protein